MKKLLSAILAMIMLVLVLDVMAPWEIRYKRKIRNITLYVEFDDIDDILTMLDEYRHAHIISAYKLENEEYLYMKSINSTLNDFTEKEQAFLVLGDPDQAARSA